MKEILTLVQFQQDGETVIASIGGFDLEYQGQRFGKDSYRYTTMLLRTGADYEIELPVTVTPLGAVSRLEHALDDFEGERERYANGWQMHAGGSRPTSPAVKESSPSSASWLKSAGNSPRSRRR